MKRRVILVLLLLVAGAIVNVAVAWGCAAWVPVTIMGQTSGEALSADDQEWLEASGWRRPRERGSDAIRMMTSATAFGLQGNQLALLGDLGADVVGFDTFAVVTRAGWPFRTFIGGRLKAMDLSGQPDRMIDAVDMNASARPVVDRDLPLRPIWPGSAINTVFYAGVLWLLFAAPFALRRRRRIKRGLCPKCAYDLRGRSGETCPECGTVCSITANARAT